jgi:hypothetical protein
MAVGDLSGKLARMEAQPNVDAVEEAIVLVRGQRVMLDADLARLYGVPTKRLNEQARRNLVRFPPDFMFQLTRAEFERLMWSQNATTLRRTKAPERNPLQAAAGSRSTRRTDQPPLS